MVRICAHLLFCLDEQCLRETTHMLVPELSLAKRTSIIYFNSFSSSWKSCPVLVCPSFPSGWLVGNFLYCFTVRSRLTAWFCWFYSEANTCQRGSAGLGGTMPTPPGSSVGVVILGSGPALEPGLLDSDTGMNLAQLFWLGGGSNCWIWLSWFRLIGRSCWWTWSFGILLIHGVSFPGRTLLMSLCS